MTDLKIFPRDGAEFKGVALQTNYYMRLLELVRGAKESIFLIQYVFGISPTREWQRSNKILKALVEAKERGVKVKVIFDRPRLHGPNTKTNITCARKLIELGMEPRSLTVRKTLHLKMVIIDKKVCITGSHNITNSSLYSPFEISFECKDPESVKEAGCYFHTLWGEGMSEPFLNAVSKIGKAGG
jgi:phosphatidylserine/phosphatidylglycerophosphate/cardiolipin synthase-like enzyme